MVLQTFLWTISCISLFVGIISLFVTLKLKRALRAITSAAHAQSLEQILSDLLLHLKVSKTNQDKLSSELRVLQEQTTMHIQRVGLVRFNPFENTGGDQSFTLALLDGHHTGFVISSLHSREQTRIFAKPIVNGTCKTFELSSEERLAIQRALPAKKQ